MRIEIRCHKCGRELKHRADLTQNLVDLTLKVEGCDNLDCRDCSKCDDAHRLKVQKVSDERLPQITPKKESEGKPSCADCKDIGCLSYGNKKKLACASIKLK